jgi:hypothetical protein
MPNVVPALAQNLRPPWLLSGSLSQVPLRAASECSSRLLGPEGQAVGTEPYRPLRLSPDAKQANPPDPSPTDPGEGELGRSTRWHWGALMATPVSHRRHLCASLCQAQAPRGPPSRRTSSWAAVGELGWGEVLRGEAPRAGDSWDIPEQSMFHPGTAGAAC